MYILQQNHFLCQNHIQLNFVFLNLAGCFYGILMNWSPAKIVKSKHNIAHMHSILSLAKECENILVGDSQY